MNEEMVLKNRKQFIKKLHNAIDMEHHTFRCFGHLSKLIRNGRIRKQFLNFVEVSRKNKKLLIGHLKALDKDYVVVEDRCYFCKLKPENFSLIGALNLGLEITGALRKLYDELLELSESTEEKILLKRLMMEKNKQKRFLKNEASFVSEKTQADFITNYCIPKIISDLYK